MNHRALLSILASTAVLASAPAALAGQAPDEPTGAPRITADFDETPLIDVLRAFADASGRSFVMAPGAAPTVSATIHDRPWDVALDAILEAHGLGTTVAASGILVVGPGAAASTAPAEPLETRVFRVRWSPAHELADVVWSMLSDGGRVAVAASTNALVVTDEPAVLARVASVLGAGG